MLNLTNGLHRSAVNRAYYAMFYAVLALFASRRAETSRQSGAISQFDQLYIKPALLPKDFSHIWTSTLSSMSTEMATVSSFSGFLKSSISYSALGSWVSMTRQNAEPYCGYISLNTSARCTAWMWWRAKTIVLPT